VGFTEFGELAGAAGGEGHFALQSQGPIASLFICHGKIT
jgi:hypothetical protein